MFWLDNDMTQRVSSLVEFNIFQQRCQFQPTRVDFAIQVFGVLNFHDLTKKDVSTFLWYHASLLCFR